MAGRKMKSAAKGINISHCESEFGAQENSLESEQIEGTSATAADKSETLAQLRARRRTAKRTQEVQEIDKSFLSCPSTELHNRFRLFLGELVQRRKCPLECHQIVLNSLLDVHQKVHPELAKQNLTAMVDEQLRVLFPHFPPVEIQTDCDLLQSKLLCLLEIYLLRSFPVHLKKTQIIPRLHSLCFFTESEDIRHFLDETLCDEFVDDLPFYLAGIYEELMLDMPADLVPFQSQEYGQEEEEEKEAEAKSMIFVNLAGPQSKATREKMDKFLAELRAEEEAEMKPPKKQKGGKEKKSAGDENGRPKSAAETLASGKMARRRRTAKTGSVNLNRSPLKTRQLQTLARRRILQQVIPETPEKQKRGAVKRTAGDDEERGEEEEIVQQTPLVKINQYNPSAEGKLAALLQREEQRMGLLSSTGGQQKQQDQRQPAQQTQRQSQSHQQQKPSAKRRILH